MKIIFNTPGLYEISGLTMTLFKNINVKYLFNKKKINSLYLHSKRFKDNNYTNLRKKNFRFKVIDSTKAISFIINNNNETVALFQNQIYYLPLKILNNNNDIEIKKFTVYLETDNDLLIYPKYLHNNYLNHNNSILIPIIGQNIGECKLKIIIKFEEKTKDSFLDIYRNVITITVFKGIYLNIEDNIYEYDEINHKREIKINMDISNHKNEQTISFIKSKYLIYDKEKFLLDEFDNQNITIDEYKDKNINLNLIVKCLNKEKKENNNDKLYEDLIESKDIPNYENITEFFKSVFCGDNNLIVKYKINFSENNKEYSINCIYRHEIKVNELPNNQMFYIDKSYIKNNLSKCFQINFEDEDLDEKQKYISINIQMIRNGYLEKIKHIIEHIEIKVNKNVNNFEWIGINSTIFNDLSELKSEENNIKTFNCLIDNDSYSLTDKKRDLNLNQFIFYVKIKNSNNIYQFTNFPYDIFLMRNF